jgi:hypothetical protein
VNAERCRQHLPLPSDLSALHAPHLKSLWLKSSLQFLGREFTLAAQYLEAVSLTCGNSTLSNRTPGHQKPGCSPYAEAAEAPVFPPMHGDTSWSDSPVSPSSSRVNHASTRVQDEATDYRFSENCSLMISSHWSQSNLDAKWSDPRETGRTI